MERRSFLSRCAGAVAACFGFGAAPKPLSVQEYQDFMFGLSRRDVDTKAKYNDDVTMLPEQYKTTDGTFVSRLHVDGTTKGFAVSSCGTYLFIALFDEAGVWRHLDSRTMFDA